MRKISFMLVLLSVPFAAFGEEYRPLNFGAMDEDGDNRITRSEWMNYYAFATTKEEAYLGVKTDQEEDFFTIETKDGPKKIRRRAQSSSRHEEDFDLLAQIKRERLDRESLFAQRAQFRETSRPLPNFEDFDKNADGRISRDEMRRIVPTVPLAARN